MSTKQGALVAAILGSAVVAVDSTVVNVALPAIEDDLGGGLAGQQWVANAYLLTLAALILVSGSLADLFGERRLFVLGVSAFGVTSVLCAVAPSIEVLVAARALQGVSGALLTPASLAILIAVFPPDERGKAIGTWTAWGGIGILLGPLLGGQIVDSADWRVVFAINIPLVLGTLALASTYVPAGEPRTAGQDRPHVDVTGAALCAVGLAGATFALIEQPMLGWSSPAVWGPGLGGLAVFAAFLRFEARTPHPMLPLGLFGRSNFRWGNLETLFMYGGIAVMGFFLGLFLQQAAGWSALEAGTTMLVPTTVMFVLSRRFGALADRLGPRAFMAAGPLLSAGGLLLLLRLDATVAFATDVLPALLLFAIGLAVSVAPLTATVLADADEHNAGIASAVNNAVARTAGLLATAAVGAALSASFAAEVDDRLGDRPLSPPAAARVDAAKDRALGVADGAGVPPAVTEATRDAAVSTFHLAMGIGAALMAAGGLLGLAGIRNPRPEDGCRDVHAEDCAGGQLAGQPQDVAQGGPQPAAVPA
ncbi:MFS transporter [Conexibacter sp. SYSU D00693]|uniref:MFS transporter n=1 Tax=Conexibacter sp. SYSU D00693 TaxID=2812560 RepID=UPI00196BA732|nr:MFS transporter [Conexibacter sp. SYSU D00693]